MKLEELESLGAEVAAIATDDPENLRKFAEGNDLGFRILHDAGGEVIRRYGIENRQHTDGVLPDPTVLVVDREGRVQWKELHEDYTVRASATAVAAAVRRITGTPPGP